MFFWRGFLVSKMGSRGTKSGWYSGWYVTFLNLNSISIETDEIGELFSIIYGGFHEFSRANASIKPRSAPYESPVIYKQIYHGSNYQ